MLYLETISIFDEENPYLSSQATPRRCSPRPQVDPDHSVHSRHVGNWSDSPASRRLLRRTILGRKAGTRIGRFTSPESLRDPGSGPGTSLSRFDAGSRLRCAGFGDQFGICGLDQPVAFQRPQGVAVVEESSARKRATSVHLRSHPSGRRRMASQLSKHARLISE